MQSTKNVLKIIDCEYGLQFYVEFDIGYYFQTINYC